jgi:hypothetical protein
MHFFLFLFVPFSITFSLTGHAACGLYGTVEKRIHSCRNGPSQHQGFIPITLNQDGIYYYSSLKDHIISPPFPEGPDDKCQRPFKKMKVNMIKTPEKNYRCVLKNASRFILLENETLK